MARKSVVPVAMEAYTQKYDSVLRRAGKRTDHEYRVKTDDPTFAMSAVDCVRCSTHNNPMQDSIGWVTLRKPLALAREWVGNHGVPATVQRRKVLVTRELGKRTAPRGTWVRLVEPIAGEGWRDWRTLSPH
jgi:hypothetical protein